jgi:hypothetical protein
VDIQGIIDAVRYNRVRISVYADEEAQADHLSFDEIFYSVLHAARSSKNIRPISLIRVA